MMQILCREWFCIDNEDEKYLFVHNSDNKAKLAYTKEETTTGLKHRTKSNLKPYWLKQLSL